MVTEEYVSDGVPEYIPGFVDSDTLGVEVNDGVPEEVADEVTRYAADDGDPLELPPEAEDLQAKLPEGWTFIGFRLLPNDDIVWEAQHATGILSAATPSALVDLVRRTVPSYAHARPEGLNRRRKRRRRITQELLRCNVCAGLVFRDQVYDHAEEFHGAAKKADEIFDKPERVTDDGTGDDMSLDDPASARRTQAED